VRPSHHISKVLHIVTWFDKHKAKGGGEGDVIRRFKAN
jgi:hypothetical protein